MSDKSNLKKIEGNWQRKLSSLVFMHYFICESSTRWSSKEEK